MRMGAHPSSQRTTATGTTSRAEDAQWQVCRYSRGTLLEPGRDSEFDRGVFADSINATRYPPPQKLVKFSDSSKWQPADCSAPRGRASGPTPTVSVGVHCRCRLRRIRAVERSGYSPRADAKPSPLAHWAPAGQGRVGCCGPSGRLSAGCASARDLGRRGALGARPPGQIPAVLDGRLDRTSIAAVMLTPVTPAPIAPSTMVSACPSVAAWPAPLSSIAPARMLDVAPLSPLELMSMPLPSTLVESSAKIAAV